MNRLFALAVVVTPLAFLGQAPAPLPELTPLYTVDQSAVPSTVMDRWNTSPEAVLAVAIRFVHDKQTQLDPALHNLPEELWASIAAIPATAEEMQHNADVFLVGERLRSVGSTFDSDPYVHAAFGRLTAPEVVVEP